MKGQETSKICLLEQGFDISVRVLFLISLLLLEQRISLLIRNRSLYKESLLIIYTEVCLNQGCTVMRTLKTKGMVDSDWLILID